MKKLGIVFLGILLLCCACQKAETQPGAETKSQMSEEAEAFLKGNNKAFMERFHE